MSLNKFIYIKIDEVQKRSSSGKHEDSNEIPLPLPAPSGHLPPGLPPSKINTY